MKKISVLKMMAVAVLAVAVSACGGGSGSGLKFEDKSDRTVMGLVGDVASVTYPNGDYAKFDRKGNLIEQKTDGTVTARTYANPKRYSEKGSFYNIVLSDTMRVDVWDNRNERLTVDYTFDRQGRIVGRAQVDYGWGTGIKYVYKGDGILPAQEIRSSGSDDGSWDEETRTYDYTKTDQQGNWTKCKVKAVTVTQLVDDLTGEDLPQTTQTETLNLERTVEYHLPPAKPKDGQITMTIESKSDVRFYLYGVGSITIDWGDGSENTAYEFEPADNPDKPDTKYFSHEYPAQSDYTITINKKSITHIYFGDWGYPRVTSWGLTNIDLSRTPELLFLSCTRNKELTHLDVSKNTKLTELNCDNNNITGLDVSNNPALELFYCNTNQLTGLDVSKNTALVLLDCGNNNLMTADAINALFATLHDKPYDASRFKAKCVVVYNRATRYTYDGKIATSKGWQIFDRR
jgi:hypothetical protein